MGTEKSVPVIVTVFEVTGTLKSTSVCGVNANASGSVSAGLVVLTNVRVNDPAVSVVVTLVDALAELIWRTQML